MFGLKTKNVKNARCLFFNVDDELRGPYLLGAIMPDSLIQKLELEPFFVGSLSLVINFLFCLVDVALGY